MAELIRVRPDNIHAVVVGLENYPMAADMSLRGAAENAVRFARWLRGGGVPSGNIRLLLSSLAESKDAIDAAVRDTGLTVCDVDTADDIRTVFVHDLDSVSGELLFVYWGGHGLLGKRAAERLLFTPEACPGDLRCLGVEELRTFLTRSDLPGFVQQVHFFDACAAFEEQYQLGESPVPVAFPVRDRRDIDQFLLYAARDGQEAEQDLAAGTGLFSCAVMDWLEEHAGDLHPDLSRLETSVRTYFDERYQGGGPLQTPMAYHYRALGAGSDGYAGYDTVFGGQVDRAALMEVTGALRATVGGRDGDCAVYAGRVAAACGLTPPSAPDPVPWFALVLLRAPRAMATFIETLTHRGEDTAAQAFLDLTLRHEVPGLLSVEEYACLEAVLARWPALSPATVNTLTQAAAPGIGVHVTADGPLSTTELMAYVGELEKYPGGRSQATRKYKVPVVVAFAQYLAVHPGPGQVSYALRRKLERWSETAAARLLVDRDELERVNDEATAWDDAQDRAGTAARVVVQVYCEAAEEDCSGAAEPEAAECRYTCVVWVGPGTGELARFPHPDNGVPLGPAHAVQLIERAVRSLTDDDSTTPGVEVILQDEDILDVTVQGWDGDPDPDVPALLGVEQRVTLRCGPLASEIREERRRAGLKRRWSRRTRTDVVYLDESHAAGDPGGQRAYGTLLADRDTARVVIRTGRRTGAALVRAALRIGYPVVIWDSADSGTLTTDDFAPLRPDGDLTELPERVRSYWAQACADSDQHPMRPALLIEDGDRPLPPVLPLDQPNVRDDEASC